MRILFIGDSITDAGRDKRNYFNLGRGYANAAAENLKAAYPEKALEFINLGINGNRTSELFDRLYPDCIFLKPDVVSVMIGINDVWHRHGNNVMTTDAQIKLNYRCTHTGKIRQIAIGSIHPVIGLFDMPGEINITAHHRRCGDIVNHPGIFSFIRLERNFS